MTTSFPGGLDAFTNPTLGDTLASPDHAAQHADVNDAVEALQAKVGVDGSAVATSLDYRVGYIEAGNLSKVVYLPPDVTTLATVTSSTVNSTALSFVEGTDLSVLFADAGYMSMTGMSAAMVTAVDNLRAGDTLNLGSWASTDGNPTSVVVAFVQNTGATSRSIYFSSFAANFNTSYVAASTGDTVGWTEYTTDITTNNSSLALSQTYYEVGGSALPSADASVAGGVITARGNHSVSSGDVVVEKYYSTGPDVKEWDSATAAWIDHAPKSVFGELTEMSALRWSFGNTTQPGSETSFGWTVFEIPSDWDDWILESTFTGGIANPSASSGFMSIYQTIIISPWISPTTDRVIVNASNPHQNAGFTPRTYPSFSLPDWLYEHQMYGGDTSLDALTASTSTFVSNYKMSKSEATAVAPSGQAPTSIGILATVFATYSGLTFSFPYLDLRLRRI